MMDAPLEEDDTADNASMLAELQREAKRDRVMNGILSALQKPAAQPVVNVPAPNITLPQLSIPAPQVIIQPAARCSWVFEFERNRDGSIKSITAKPLSKE
jgi:hypothetical protein